MNSDKENKWADERILGGGKLVDEVTRQVVLARKYRLLASDRLEKASELIVKTCKKRSILKTMIPASRPDELVQKCRSLARQGNHGVLISGGCSTDGCLPWGPFIDAIATIKAETHFKLPHTPISLGCARQRGNTKLELLAIDAGINRLALPSDEAVDKAHEYGLEIQYQPTCCSVSRDYYSAPWI